MRLYSLSPYGSECIFTEYLRYDLRAQDKYLLEYQLRRYSDPLECVFIYDLHVNVDLFFVLNMGKTTTMVLVCNVLLATQTFQYHSKK